MPAAHDCPSAPLYRAGRQWGFPGRAACAPPRPHPPLGTLLSYQPDGSVPAPAPPAAPAPPDPAGSHAASSRGSVRDPRPCPARPRPPRHGTPGPSRSGGGCTTAALSGAPPGRPGGRGGVQGPTVTAGLPRTRLRNSGKRRAPERPGIHRRARRCLLRCRTRGCSRHRHRPGSALLGTATATSRCSGAAGHSRDIPPDPGGERGDPAASRHPSPGPYRAGNISATPARRPAELWALRCGRRAPEPEGTEHRSPAPTRAVALPPQGKQRLDTAGEGPSQGSRPPPPRRPGPGPGGSRAAAGARCAKRAGDFCAPAPAGGGERPGPGASFPGGGRGTGSSGAGLPLHATTPPGVRAGPPGGRSPGWPGVPPLLHQSGAADPGRGSPCRERPERPRRAAAERGAAPPGPPGPRPRGVAVAGAVAAVRGCARCLARSAERRAGGPAGGRGRAPRGGGHRRGSGAPSRGAARRAAEDE